MGVLKYYNGTDWEKVGTGVAGSGSGGTSDYSQLENKPGINGNELIGDKTSTQLGLAAETHNHAASDITGLASVATTGSYNDLSNKPTIPTVDTALSSSSTNPVQNKIIKSELDGKAAAAHTHTKSEITDFPTTEEWVFTLEDSSTVTKLVYVG